MPPSWILSGEIGRRHQNVGKHHRGLRIARGKRRQPLGPLHDGVPVVDDAAEALRQPAPFGALALQQRDLFGVFAHPHEVEAEIGLIALLLEIEVDQRRADPLRQRGSEDGVDQRAPHQIAGDREFTAENVQRGFRGQAPQDDDKGCQRHHRAQKADADIQRLVDEQFDVVGDALVRIVGGIALSCMR